ncbi:DUF4493 domain-containing protein [Phocaeicola plebeius]|uniref:DUF4493 domain-containing protein n=1 Tax=Phocaeicola plebeius TaxID=310297 RepID=UPI003FEF4821
MKKVFLIIGIISSLCACRQENRYLGEGEGALSLQVTMGEAVEVVSRTSLGNEEIEALKNDCKVRIYEGDKLIRKYSSWSSVPEKIDLSAGTDYRVRVVAGDSVSASLDKKYYEGVETFSVVDGQTTSVEVNCNIANTLVKVNFSEELKKYLASGAVTVSVDAGNGALDYNWSEEGTESPVGYYMLPSGKEYLTCVFNATTKNGKKITQTNKIEPAKASTLYTLTYALSTEEPEHPTDEGGAFFSLKVDETPLYTQKEEIGIYRRPVIRVMSGEEEISTDSPWFLSLNSSVSPQIIMSGSSTLTTASVEGTLLEKLGLSGIVDLLSEESVGVLQQKGISLTIPAEAQGKQIVMDWGKSWNKLLKEETMYSLRYVLVDEQGKQRELDWQIVVSDMNVQAVEIPRFETWADRTVFYGEVIEGHTPGAAVYSFQYRKKGEEAWSQNIPAVLSGQTIKSDVLKGLTPGTTYEYRILEDTKISNMICEVTTESVFLLDNNSFEYTSRDGKVLRISPDPSNYWWDSGNEGSATLNKDVTYPDTSVKHSGSQSLKLQSQYVAFLGIGKFAAGNLFAGEFLDTEDAYYGILGWGRTCTTRPLALRAWVRYTPGTVDYTETDKISKGDKDKGIIYIAVGDWVSDDAKYGSQWPVVVRTKGPKLFNPKDTGTIGYGEMIFTDNVGLDENGGMKEVIIPLDYDNYGGRTRIPTHIIIVASASQYGDYYSGSTSSVMWLDDLELIYEESKLPENLR